MSQLHAGTQHTERSINDNRAERPMETPTSVAKPPAAAPTARQRWSAARPSKMMTFGLCLAAVLITLFIGFTWGGWTTAGAAQGQANSAAQTAVVHRLANICVAQFGNDGAHVQKLAELRAKNASERSSFISDGGWATMPGEKAPDSRVVSECVQQLLATASK